MQKNFNAVFCTEFKGGGGKSFLRQKMTKVMKFFGGKGGVGTFFFFLFFLKIHSIYDRLLIGSFNKSFLEILQR